MISRSLVFVLLNTPYIVRCVSDS